MDQDRTLLKPQASKPRKPRTEPKEEDKTQATFNFVDKTTISYISLRQQVPTGRTISSRISDKPGL